MARAVTAAPGEKVNPVYIYGSVGVGKTHLLQAIGNEITRERPQLKVAYLPIRFLIDQLIHAIRYDVVPQFREQCRSVDVLLLDDAQDLINKERTQEEVLGLIDALETSNKQVVVVADRRL